jgi:hypothetical protein|tara:strand:- start:4684 stop:5256 length:573 start_codon:yes stop_codon:yes gene_type:complete
MAGKSKIVKGALGQLIDATDLFRKKPLSKEEQGLLDKLRGLTLRTFEGDPIDTSKYSDAELLKVTKPVSGREMSKIMGLSDEYIDAEQKAGVRFFEKPTYFEDIKDSISSSQLNDLEQIFGRKLNTYNINDILSNPKQPLSDLMHQNLKDEDQIKGSSFIVWDPDKKARYLANTSGANKYIRMWTGIDYN